jgi:Dimerisation domain
MSLQDTPLPFVLFRMITGYYVSQAIYVAARLGIADLIGDSRRAIEDLANQTKTHAASLRRVLRLLASAGLFAEDQDGRFSLTPIGAYLRSNVPGSMHAAALLFGGITQRTWGHLLHSVETGEPAFRLVFGEDPFAYFAEHPDEGANFDTTIAAFTTLIDGRGHRVRLHTIPPDRRHRRRKRRASRRHSSCPPYAEGGALRSSARGRTSWSATPRAGSC